MPTKNRLFLLGIMALFMGACSSSLKPEPSLLSKERTHGCQEELEKSIATLIHAQKIHLSTDVFSKNSSLYLTNQKMNIFGQSRIINDITGRKKILLYKNSNRLYIATVNNKEEILKSKELKSCQTSY